MSIRPYQPGDRNAVETICADTGLKGNLDAYFCDRELFAQIWLAPFLDGESESAWVSEECGRITGYLVSAIRPGFSVRALRCALPYLARLGWNQISGKYRHHPASGRFVRWVFTQSWRDVPANPDELSTLHFNLAEDERGSKRLGDLLLDVYFAELRRRGHARFCIHIFVQGKHRNLRFYLRFGFKLVDVRVSHLFVEPTLVAALERAVPAEGENYMANRRVRTPRLIAIVDNPDGFDQASKTMPLPPDAVVSSLDELESRQPDDIFIFAKDVHAFAIDTLPRVMIAVDRGRLSGVEGKVRYQAAYATSA